EDAPDLFVHAGDHGGVGLHVAAIEMPQRAARLYRSQPRGLGLVLWPFPRPVRRREVQADEPGPRAFPQSLERLHGLVGQQVGQVSGLLDARVSIPEVRLAVVSMREVIDRGAANAPELFVAALQRTVVRQLSEMPL